LRVRNGLEKHLENWKPPKLSRHCGVLKVIPPENNRVSREKTTRRLLTRARPKQATGGWLSRRWALVA
jgi:hypothetical protein